MINYRYMIRGMALAGAMAIGPIAALADGVPTRAPRAVVEAPFSWTGFYGGANVGAAWLDDGAMVAAPADAATAAFWGPCNAAGACPFNRGSETSTGVIGGIQLGYNLQFGSLVAGIEADIQGSTANASRGVFQGPPNFGFVQFQGAGNASLEWLGTVRGRLGFLATPTFLVYATGGWAYAEVERSWGQFFTIAGQNVAGRNTHWDSGWTAGGGFEFAVAPRVTVGGEYLFVGLDGGDTFRATAVPPIVAGGCTVGNCHFNVRGGDLDIHIARLKVNFKF